MKIYLQNSKDNKNTHAGPQFHNYDALQKDTQEKYEGKISYLNLTYYAD